MNDPVDHANRPADVLEMFEHAPGWGGKDLADVYFERSGYYDRNKTPFGYYAAWALAKVGRKDEAFRVLQPTLYFARACDPGYALLLDIKVILMTFPVVLRGTNAY